MKKQWTTTLLILLALLNLCRNFLWLIPSVLMGPLMEELSIGYAQAGYLVLTVTVLMGVFLIFGNVVIQKLGPIGAMLLGLGCLAVDGLCMGLGGQYAVLLTGKLFSGAGYGLTTCASTALVASSFPKARLSVANGLHACITMLSITCAYQFIQPISLAAGSWKREALLWVGGCAVTALLFLLWGRASGARRPAPVPRGSGNIRTALRVPLVRAAVLVMSSLMLIYVCVTSYYPNFLGEARGFSVQAAGSIAGRVSIFGMAGSLLLGAFYPRVRRRRLLKGCLLAAMAAGFAGMLLFHNQWALTGAVAAFGASYTAMSAYYSTTIMHLPQLTPLAAGAGVSLMSAFGSLLALLVPSIQEGLADIWGLEAAMSLFAVLFIPALLGMAFDRK